MTIPSVPAATQAAAPHQSFWLWVMCLTGVDYFSTLGYQPSIAVANTGILAPLATVVLVLVTFFGALPVYAYVAGKSFEGQGSIGMLAKLVTGWPGKVMVLVLLGFAATDFVITKTLSAADAAEHLISNPLFKAHVTDPLPGDHRMQIGATMFLLILLGGTFMRGFREVIGLAATIVGVYLALNVVVIGSGLAYLAKHTEKFDAWIANLQAGRWHIYESPMTPDGSWWTILLVCLLLFPKLALGLSGFETGVAVMGLVRGNATDDPKNPTGRIRHTRWLLLTAAAIMSIGLLGSSLVVTTLISPDKITPVLVDGSPPGGITDKELWPKQPATARALAYIAHGEDRPADDAISPLFGETFGTIYDISTIVILWFAGASAMAGLLNLVPKYLPLYGMAPEWARAVRPLVLLFTAINLIVTLIFKADVDAQSDAYATGVLVLMTSACVATLIDRWHANSGAWYRRIAYVYFAITLVFLYTTLANIIEKPMGLVISSIFIAMILFTSFWSRFLRSRELRFGGFKLADGESKLLWDSIRFLELTILVPHRPGRRTLAAKESQIRREHRIPRDLMIVFVEVALDDASDFVNEPGMQVRQEGGRYVIKITGAASIAHTLAAVSLEMARVGRPPEIHFGWTDDSPVSGTLGFLLFGEGNVPWMVRELIRKAEPDEAKRPLVIIAGSA